MTKAKKLLNEIYDSLDMMLKDEDIVDESESDCEDENNNQICDARHSLRGIFTQESNTKIDDYEDSSSSDETEVQT